MVGWQFYLARIVPELFCGSGRVQATFVRDIGIEDGKKRLSGFPVFVMGVPA
jgi:hypothetical protein